MDKGFITFITQEEDGSFTNKRIKYQEGMKVQDLVDGNYQLYSPMEFNHLDDLLDHMESKQLEEMEFISKRGERYQIKKFGITHPWNSIVE
jgi:hypothetical protein